MQGSTDDIALKLQLWCSAGPPGMSLVKYRSEYSRGAAALRLSSVLERKQIPYSEIVFDAQQPTGSGLGLLQALSELPEGVASIRVAGSSTHRAEVRRALGEINLLRERLAGTPLRQVWWVHESLASEFARWVPDFDSWFQIRLSLQEDPVRDIETFQMTGGQRLSVSEAREIVTTLGSQAKSFLRSPLANLGVGDAQLLEDYALALGTIGRTDDALSAQKLAVQVRTSRQGTDHPDTLRSLSGQARMHKEKGDHTAAEEIAKHVYETRGRLFGQAHYSTLIAANDLGTLYDSIGRSSDAIELLTAALEIGQRELGKLHSQTLLMALNLGSACGKIGDLSRAKQLITESYEAMLKVLGPDHPFTVSALNALASVNSRLGLDQTAESLFSEAFRSSERILGRDHPITLLCLNNWALQLKKMGRLRKASDLFHRAVSESELVLGPDHPNSLAPKYNLAQLLVLQGKLAEASALLTAALPAADKVLGAQDPRTIRIRQGLQDLASLAT